MIVVSLGTPGTWTETFEAVADRNQIAAYTAATNETDPRMLRGELAPPMYTTIPVRPAARAAFDDAMPDGLPASIPRLAGEQDMVFNEPITAGMRLLCRSRFRAISPKSTGTVLQFEVETRSADDHRVINVQYMSTFLPRAAWPSTAGEPVAALGFDRALLRAGVPVLEAEQRFDLDQTYRYSDASGDLSRWHLDDEYARAAGLPGIIIHGLCTMAFVARALIEGVGGGQVGNLARLSVRFSKIIRPGQVILTRVWRGSNGYVFETLGPDGEPVLSNGWAEMRSS